ncbi:MULTISPECIES: LacI family DNA-binding transcriptional regulator [unclassified Pantoea]|uniref:LacI family DNA-binding transcriptional regulator n=1 Tax=unclassified Pantoea TaxID=2630326 RepID=UPI001CD43456|nr:MULTISPECIES: LacI family DNA-binding transcriptional regulator [unclassified Pantoea]MCA1177422.1 LacI family DNA-binding transcriptional regulator [Pantoea sp. alder69]MCA1249672.1 LacI family DNA-binding transcriptional regulator [Pantoea sp. alder70]MCA1265911.1 LacI family DNA-binding transcriptional regulator [Pantoea sp. alder81]
MKQRNPERNAAPTLEDVARVAGISPMTVSRALNSPHQVRPATVAKVKAAISATGYIPNAQAGSLASNRSRLIAIVVPQINNNMFVDTIQSLNDSLSARGYHMLLCVTGYEAETEAETVSTLLSRRPDGIVLTGIHHSAQLKKVLLQANVPVVEIWDMTPTPIDMLVGFSHEKIGARVAAYLAERGYQKPGLIWTDDRRALQRKQGLLDALTGLDINPLVDMPVQLPALMARGREACSQLLDQHPEVDVLVCSSDTLAQGALMAAQARGLNIPQQVAVIGFGDLDFAAANYPAITTVRIDRQRMGELAAEQLLKRLQNQRVENLIIDMGFTMVPRDSG